MTKEQTMELRLLLKMDSVQTLSYNGSPYYIETHKDGFYVLNSILHNKIIFHKASTIFKLIKLIPKVNKW